VSEQHKTGYHTSLFTVSPPDNGILEFTVAAAPVAAQAKLKSRKAALRDEVRKLFVPLRYLLSGEVHVDIEWAIHEKDRYETDAAPDIDAILKPLLDAMSGPDGVLVDDSQVQSVACRWIDYGSREQSLKFEIRFLAHEWVSKKGLIFVHFGDSLCFPLEDTMPTDLALRCAETVRRMLDTKRKIEAETGDYYAARRMLPAQRMFHRTRVAQKFDVLEEAVYIGRLRKAQRVAIT
jgi:Holliday junction resolvase RusA-like endonuclease